MAYWGVARTWYHPIWAPPSPEELKQGAAAMDRALAIDPKTGRERDYIQALSVFYKDWQTVDHATRAKNYERALAGVCERNPNDDEAAIFHALQLVAIGYLDPTDKSYTWQKKGSEILNGLLPRHQNHPGVAHYIIHSVDYPPLAELGLKAARAYAAIAPDSPHALHMPSHIFTRLGLWDDSITSNTASTKSAIAQSQRLHGGGGSFDQLHAIDYLVYAYLAAGEGRERSKVLAEMQAIDQAGRKPVRRRLRLCGLAGTLGFREARLESGCGARDHARAWFPWDRFRNVEALVHYARAIGAARAGDVPAARRSADEIAAIRKAMPATRDYDWSGSIGAQWEAATALIAWAEGKKSEGIRLLRVAADHEDAVDKHPVTPGALLPDPRDAGRSSAREWSGG